MSNLQNKKQKSSEEIKKLEVERLKKELEEYKNKYLRVLADYQNLEKRAEEQKKQMAKEANRGLILKLLPLLDSLDKAAIFIKDDGLKIIRNSFIQLLQNEGVEEIQILNKIFDPYLAEAVEVVEGDKDNIIVEILRKGYKYNGKVLRVAQVKVSKKSSKIKYQNLKLKGE